MVSRPGVGDITAEDGDDASVDGESDAMFGRRVDDWRYMVCV